MPETPIYDRAMALLDDLDALSEQGDLPGYLLVALVNTRAVACSNLAIAEALHRARDTLAGSSDERSENG